MHTCTHTYCTHSLHTHITCAYGFLASNVLIKFLTSLYPHETKTCNGWFLLDFCMKRLSHGYLSFSLFLLCLFLFFPCKFITNILCYSLAKSHNCQSFSLPFCALRITGIRGSSVNYVCKAPWNHKREGAMQAAAIITVISKAVGGKEDKIRISVCSIYVLHCSQHSMNSWILIALPG